MRPPCLAMWHATAGASHSAIAPGWGRIASIQVAGSVFGFIGCQPRVRGRLGTLHHKGDRQHNCTSKPDNEANRSPDRTHGVPALTRRSCTRSSRTAPLLRRLPPISLWRPADTHTCVWHVACSRRRHTWEGANMMAIDLRGNAWAAPASCQTTGEVVSDTLAPHGGGDAVSRIVFAKQYLMRLAVRARRLCLPILAGALLATTTAPAGARLDAGGDMSRDLAKGVTANGVETIYATTQHDGNSGDYLTLWAFCPDVDCAAAIAAG